MKCRAYAVCLLAGLLCGGLGTSALASLPMHMDVSRRDWTVNTTFGRFGYREVIVSYRSGTDTSAWFYAGPFDSFPTRVSHRQVAVAAGFAPAVLLCLLIRKVWLDRNLMRKRPNTELGNE